MFEGSSVMLRLSSPQLLRSASAHSTDKWASWASREEKREEPRAQSVRMDNLLPYYERVRSYLSGLVRDPNDVDDLVQETYLKAYRFARSRDPPRDPLPWLLTTARNATVDRYRRKGPLRDAVSFADGDGYHVDGPLEESVVREQTERVYSGLDALREQDRELLRGYYFAGRPGRDLADSLGTNPGAIKARMHRARGRLLNAVVASRASEGGVGQSQ